MFSPKPTPKASFSAVSKSGARRFARRLVLGCGDASYETAPQDILPGIRVDGEVLAGKKSVELARALEAVRAAKLQAGNREWIRVEDYDPVLRAHCRLDGEG